MKYSRCKDKIVVRIDRGEEILSAVSEVARKEKVKLAKISAIGATDDFTVGVFDGVKKEYKKYDFKGDYEILSVEGNVSEKDKKPYVHAHICAAGEGGKTVGGHLMKAVVSLTCELFLDVLDGKAERTFNETLGINELNF